MSNLPDNIREACKMLCYDISDNRRKTLSIKIVNHFIGDYNPDDNDVNVYRLGISYIPVDSFMKFTNLTKLDVSANKLKLLPQLPDTLTRLNCHMNELTSIYIPPNIKYLICYCNNITLINALPESLIELSCYSNRLKLLPPLPKKLTFLSADRNGRAVNKIDNKFNQTRHYLPIEEGYEWVRNGFKYFNTTDTEISYNYKSCINYMPDDCFSLFTNLTNLNLCDLGLKCVPTLPLTLVELDLTTNLLEDLSQAEQLTCLVKLIIRYNQFTTIPEIPPSLKYLSCGNNNLESIDVSKYSELIKFEYND